MNVVTFLTNMLPESFAFYDKAYRYLNSDVYGENTRVNMFLSFFPSFLIPSISLIILRSNYHMRTLSVFIISSIIFQILTTKMYIFYRFNNYSLLPLAVAYSEVIYILSNRIIWKDGKRFLFIPILFLYISYKIYNVYSGSDETVNKVNAKMYDRYYPYVSIIDKGS